MDFFRDLLESNDMLVMYRESYPLDVDAAVPEPRAGPGVCDPRWLDEHQIFRGLQHARAAELVCPEPRMFLHWAILKERR